ncbi:TonB C-terminal domain-containing protein [Mesoterricola sediminis]|uniref:Uncharacterized protein n=1 Tax=Mesoterricola sediminis TaxID=2927980 RepID=A0AA48GY44_9BACT|nr:TonB C-terminal domain-containing protein [Mesoterricola sediminis]BDU78419.1 hypothetical protein METESE_33770 [Mesoterricola sediminis]
MKIPLLLPAALLCLQAHAERPARVPYAESADLVLGALEEGAALPPPPAASTDPAALAWLRAAAGPGRPRNPFRPGTDRWREAEAVRRLASAPDPARALADLPLTLDGSGLAVWRWGRAAGAAPALRRLWEDRILGAPVAGLLRGWALRHALCFALAEADRDRFTALREAWGEDAPGDFLGFQRAFALLGAPTPMFRLWSLPGLDYRETDLRGLGGEAFLITPFRGEAPAPGEGQWILPVEEGRLGGFPVSLPGQAMERARDLAARMAAAGREGWLLPGEEPLQAWGLVLFPVRIRLAPDGTVRSIRMGDAALDQAAPAP